MEGIKMGIMMSLLVCDGRHSDGTSEITDEGDQLNIDTFRYKGESGQY